MMDKREYNHLRKKTTKEPVYLMLRNRFIVKTFLLNSITWWIKYAQNANTLEAAYRPGVS